jgi:hypothetical protein
MSDLCLIDEALDVLKKDLTGDRSSIAAQSGIPFAILRYAPGDEFRFRRKIRLFANELKQSHHLSCGFISLARFVWAAITESDGVEYLFETEQKNGITKAQEHISSLMDAKREALAPGRQLMRRLETFNVRPDLLFLVRAGGIAPNIYRSSTLLHELQDLGLQTPTILCYPGSSVVGTDLRFYDLPSEEGLGTYNYRVKIYGAQ